jgi:hypothetical protein
MRFHALALDRLLEDASTRGITSRGFRTPAVTIA